MALAYKREGTEEEAENKGREARTFEKAERKLREGAVERQRG